MAWFDLDGAIRSAILRRIEGGSDRSLNFLLRLLESLAPSGLDLTPARLRRLYAGFDPVFYGAAVRHPLFHYLSEGERAGRWPNELFDPAFYRAQIAVPVDETAFGHYLDTGAAAPNPLFDAAFYLAANPDVRAQGLDPLLHYLLAGDKEGRRPHILFDPAHYRRIVAVPEGSTALGHYLRTSEGDPVPEFDSAFYRRFIPEGVNPLIHYLREGDAAGLSPHPLFDPAFYRKAQPTEDGVTALAHYLNSGAGDPHPALISSYYLNRYPEIADSGRDPWHDYLSLGDEEGRQPNPFFDPAYYRGEVEIPAGRNSLVHYLETQSGNPSPAFDTEFYLSIHPELAETGRHPLIHYLLEGRHRGDATNEIAYRAAQEAQAALNALEALAAQNEKKAQEAADLVAWRGARRTILFVLGPRPAEALRHVRELAALIDGEWAAYRLDILAEGRLRLSAWDPALSSQMEFDRDADRDALMSVLSQIGCTAIHLHLSLSTSDPIASLLGSIGLPILTTLHEDFDFLPQGLPDDRNLEAWRREIGWNFAHSRAVIVPNATLMTEIAARYSDAPLIYAPHFETEPPETIAPEVRNIAPSERLKILVLDENGQGAHLAGSVSALARRIGAPLRFITPGVGAQWPEADLAWFPAQIEEAYLYGLSDAMRARLAVCGYDAGVFPLRVASRPWSFVVPANLGAEIWVALFEEWAIRHFMLGQPPNPVPGAPYMRNDFYPAGYLELLDETVQTAARAVPPMRLASH